MSRFRHLLCGVLPGLKVLVNILLHASAYQLPVSPWKHQTATGNEKSHWLDQLAVPAFFKNPQNECLKTTTILLAHHSVGRLAGSVCAGLPGLAWDPHMSVISWLLDDLGTSSGWLISTVCSCIQPSWAQQLFTVTLASPLVNSHKAGFKGSGNRFHLLMQGVAKYCGHFCNPLPWFSNWDSFPQGKSCVQNKERSPRGIVRIDLERMKSFFWI